MCKNFFPLPSLCMCVSQLLWPGEGFFVQAGVCFSFFWGWTELNFQQLRLLNRCLLFDTGCTQAVRGSGKEQKHELIAFCCLLEKASLLREFESVLTSAMDRFEGQPSAQVSYRLVHSPQPLFFFFWQQSEVLWLVSPLEGSPVHVSHLFCIGEYRK